MNADQEKEWLELAKDVRLALVEAENTTYYLAAVIRRYKRVHLWAKIVVAAASCVPFIVKLTSVSGAVASWFTSVVPLIAISLPLWNPDKIVEVTSKAHGKYAPLLTKLNGLWREIRVKPANDASKSITRFKEALTEIDALKQTVRDGITEVPDIQSIRARSKIKSEADYPFQPNEPPRVARTVDPVLHLGHL